MQFKDPDKPPRGLVWLFRLIISREIRDEMEGDLVELFDQRREERGHLFASMHYLKDVFLSLRNSRLNRKRNEYNQINMNLTHFKIARRQLSKHKVNTVINITGLSIGLSAALILLIFVRNELSFDRFHSNYASLSRLNKVVHSNLGSSKNAESSGAFGPGMVEEFPEVMASVRVRNLGTRLISFEQQSAHVDDVHYADENFFEVFDFQMIMGVASEVLKAPSSIVLTESAARAVFGHLDVIGNEVIGPLGRKFNVSGIALDPPKNSHLQFQALISWTTTVPGIGSTPEEWMNNWRSQGITTYILLNSESSFDKVNAALPAFEERHMGDRAERYDFYLQPFGDIYLSSSDLEGSTAMTGKGFIYSLTVVGLLILLISVFNYVMISTSRASLREKEMSVRKVIGAEKKQLVMQFLIESFVLVLLAFVIALVMTWWLLPFFNNYTGRSLSLETIDLNTWLGMSALIPLTSILAGVYPAFVMANSSSDRLIKSRVKTSSSGKLLQSWSSWFQFTVAIVIMIGVLVIRKQNQYFNTKDLGYSPTSIMNLRLTPSIFMNLQSFMDQMDANPDIVNYSFSQQTPAQGNLRNSIYVDGLEENKILTRDFRIGHDFLDTYSISLIKGRSFDRNLRTDDRTILINETLEKQIEGDAIGRKVRLLRKEYTIIGVVRDIHFRSLHEQIGPMIMHLYPSYLSMLSLKYADGRGEEVRLFLQNQWESMEQRIPFSSDYLEDQLAGQYAEENDLMKALTLFATVSLLISCLGIYALTSLVVQVRKREVGIRRVLGAKEFGLMLLLNSSFFRTLALALLAAIPIAYWLTDNWLQQFAYQVSMGWAPFVFAGLIALIVTLLTVSYQSWKTANTNPVEVLRSE